MKTLDHYLSEAFVNTDQTDTLCPIKMFRGAIEDENSAANLYDTIVERIKQRAESDEQFRPFAAECEEVIKEIAADERNHIGKLLYLLKKVDPEGFEKTEAGLQNEE